MTELFADTGYWIAPLNDRDYLHEKASEISATLTGQRIVATKMVLTELLNYASRDGSTSAGSQERPRRRSRLDAAWK